MFLGKLHIQKQNCELLSYTMQKNVFNMDKRLKLKSSPFLVPLIFCLTIIALEIAVVLSQPPQLYLYSPPMPNPQIVNIHLLFLSWATDTTNSSAALSSLPNAWFQKHFSLVPLLKLFITSFFLLCHSDSLSLSLLPPL